jgi:hypothetical protein
MATHPAVPGIVAGPEALAEFRRGLTGERAFAWLDEARGRLLITLPVGAGKTEFMIKILTCVKSVATQFDLVVVLVPRRDLLEEILRKLPPGHPSIVLEPSPRRRCGGLDARWVELEKAGCGLLGRESLCGPCPRRAGCRWPGQYRRDRLEGAPLILATQHHLVLNPGFIGQLRELTGARRPLVLLDESDFLVKGDRREIARADLQRYLHVLEEVRSRADAAPDELLESIALARVLIEAPTVDLQFGRWSVPRLGGRPALDIQRIGRERFGPEYRHLTFELGHFARSDPASREQTAVGDIQYACLPDLGDEFIVFSGSIARELARYRLDPDHRRPGLYSPLEGVRFEHPGTKIYNIGSLAGAAKNFPGNAPAILDFFAAKIARNIHAGRRTLLVARKSFLGLCAEYLTRRLRELGAGSVNVVTGGWDEVDLTDPRTLPLINYGVSGVNRFEDFDAAYCLTGYYTNAAAVAGVVQDIDPAADRFPIGIQLVGDPPRRRATVELPDDRETLLPRIAQGVLDQKEADVVVQAVGRVRPFTKPREVITLQVGDLPGVHYTLAFSTLAQARAYFGIPTRRRALVDEKAAEARRLKDLGRSHAEIEESLDVSRSTVKRYLRSEGGSRTLS